MRRLLLLLVLVAGCGTETKDHCSVKDDCLNGDECVASTCQGGDHDSCGASHEMCAADATCANTGDALACTCAQGFAGDGRTCADVDECAATQSACAAHATCSNQPGSFACACDDNFTGDGTGYCVPSRFTKLVAAGTFTCGLSADGGIYCWGSNYLGDLGDGTSLAHARPLQVGTSTDWIDVSARRNEGCGLRADHSMWCWGDGGMGQLGDGKSKTSYTPVQVVSDKPGVGWKQIMVGRSNACAIHTDGSLACWGQNRATNISAAMPVAIGTDTDWTAISPGDVTCGLRDGGHLYCWGSSRDGLLGLGDTITVQTTPAQVGTDTWSSVYVGYYNACGIHSDGALFCWGTNPLLTNTLQYGKTPVQVGTATDWQSVGVAADSAMGVRTGGKAYAWGANDSGQLGLPLAYEVVEPTQLGDANLVWSLVSPGNVHGCGIANDQAYCWGSVGEGLLGDGVATTRLAPTKLSDELWDSVVTDSVGLRGVRQDGALMASGLYLQAGVGFGNLDPVWSPMRIGTDTWSTVDASRGIGFPWLSCAIRSGTPYCWGDNESGQVGIASVVTPQLSPVAVHVQAGSQWSEIAPGEHTCAIRSDGALFCWGADYSGQLGDGTTGNTPITAPTTALGGTWSHVAVSGTTTCAIRADHTLWCWGQDRPATPNTNHLVPTQVGTATDWDSITVFSSIGSTLSLCGIKTGGTLWCWGAMTTQAGTQTIAEPTQFGSATNWKTIALGDERCGIKTDGTLWCWDNGDILGDGSPLTLDTSGFTVTVLEPTQIGTDTDWKTVSTGGPSCGTKTGGSMLCWGFGAATTPGIKIVPVAVK